MKNKFLSIGVLLLTGIVMFSCSSDDGTQCPPDFTGELSTNEEKLVGEWVLSAIVAGEALDLTDDGVDNPSTNLYGQYTDCQQDAVYTFGSQRTFSYEEGQNAEDCTNKIQTSGTWELSSNTLRLTASCTIQSTTVEFNTEATEFSFAETFNVKDVTGTTTQTTIAFTYALVP
ncbi:DUF5004 domain-containing protein [Flagellimonas crocea]|uniref:DUF5004 domain-containing protein n=1 Tax=Flagellimonas crocea TaxID=3067311 RepID=UPI00296FC810|nr:DUF5004 domain-containing protein [Muricauda sp. DH64]